jgi:hypothetical protein
MDGGLAKFVVPVVWVVGIVVVIWGFSWFSGRGKRRPGRRTSGLRPSGGASIDQKADRRLFPAIREDVQAPPDAIAGRSFSEMRDPDAQELLREASQALSAGDRDRAAQLLRQAGGRAPGQPEWQVQGDEPEPERNQLFTIIEWSIRGVIVLAAIIAIIFVYLFTRGIIG